MLTEAQLQRILTLLDSDVLNHLFDATDHPGLASALYARQPGEQAAGDALRAEMGGKCTDAFRRYELVVSASQSDSERAAFLRGMIAGRLVGPLFGDDVPDQAESSSAPAAPAAVWDEAPALAPEFVNVLQESATETLRGWLTAHAAPAAVLELLSGLLSLDNYLQDAEDGRVCMPFNDSIADDVTQVVNAIAALGGVFHGPYIVSTARPTS